MKAVLALIMLLGTSSAFANVSITCGNQVNMEEGTVGQPSFMISSEDEEVFTAYNSKNQQIKNSSVKQDPKTGALTLTIVIEQGVGPVGHKYVIDNYRGENFTVAHKFNLGGIAGGLQTGQLDCVVVEM